MLAAAREWWVGFDFAFGSLHWCIGIWGLARPRHGDTHLPVLTQGPLDPIPPSGHLLIPNTCPPIPLSSLPENTSPSSNICLCPVCLNAVVFLVVLT